jgi:hypothetical protein
VMSCSAQISRTMVAMPKSPATSLRYALWSVAPGTMFTLTPIFPDATAGEISPYIGQHSTRLRWPGGGAVLIFEGPSLSKTHRPSRIAAAIADPSSVTRTCVTAQLVAGAKREAVLKSLLSDYSMVAALLGLCPVSHEMVRTFDRSPFGGSRNIGSQSTERTVEFHQGISAGATWGTGIVDRIKPHFLVQTLSWGIKEPPTLRFRREPRPSLTSVRVVFNIRRIHSIAIFRFLLIASTVITRLLLYGIVERGFAVHLNLVLSS